MSPDCVGFKMKFFAVNVSLVKTNALVRPGFVEMQGSRTVCGVHDH